MVAEKLAKEGHNYCTTVNPLLRIDKTPSFVVKKLCLDKGLFGVYEDTVGSDFSDEGHVT